MDSNIYRNPVYKDLGASSGLPTPRSELTAGFSR